MRVRACTCVCACGEGCTYACACTHAWKEMAHQNSDECVLHSISSKAPRALNAALWFIIGSGQPAVTLATGELMILSMPVVFGEVGTLRSQRLV